MTTLDPALMNQMANVLYRKTLVPPASFDNIKNNNGIISKSQLGETASFGGGDQPVHIDSSRSGPDGKPDLTPSGAYYFLNFLDLEEDILLKKTLVSDFEVETIRRDFPILQQKVNGQPLIWFDNAATTQKPQVVLDTLAQFYSESNSNVHRGAHTMATKATDAYEKAREKIQYFLGASSPEEIIFVRGATEGINLVAQTYGRMVFEKGDRVLLSVMEHHSNIVPWQMLREATGAIIQAIPITDSGEIDLDEYEKLLTRRPKMVAVTHVSNVLGTINPVRKMVEMAHSYGACVLVDGAQAVAHLPVDVKELDADFYTFSGHKVYGPTGIGVLYGKKDLLEAMPPWQGGGSMIEDVTFEETTYKELPYKFEAGTGNIADAVGLGAAIDYLQKVGRSKVERYEQKITGYALAELDRIRKLHLMGTSQHKTGVISFLVDGISPKELARHLDQKGIATRVGHHCAQPLMRRYGIESAVRASLGIYNTKDEIELMVEKLKEL